LSISKISPSKRKSKERRITNPVIQLKKLKDFIATNLYKTNYKLVTPPLLI
jgi:hypothetical protein